VVPRYLGVMVWPAGQNIDPDVALHPRPDAAVLAGIAVLAALTAAAWLARRRVPLMWLGWMWFAIAMLPESSVVPITDPMFEHRVYLPFAGIAWGVGAALAAFATGGRRRWLLPAAVIVALTACTHARNRVWRDEVTLWSDATRKSPRKPRPFINLGVAMEKRERLAEAERAYRRAVELGPADADALLNLARLYGRTGRFREALPLHLQAAKLRPESASIFDDLGTTWFGVGDTARAAAAYARAIELARHEMETSPRGTLVLPVLRHASNNLALIRSRGKERAAEAVSTRPAGRGSP
jgi:protein O-mannosyl-transferase